MGVGMPWNSLSRSARSQNVASAACLAGILLVTMGCQSLGPATVPQDRADYSEAISESWKRQALLNIVKLRYVDTPIFVDVGQIVAGYSLERSLSVGASFPETMAFGGDTASFGGAARYTDRPTVTYVPLTGDNFMRALLAPLPPTAVFFLLESGHPADVVLLSSTASLNGLKNQEVSIEGVTPPDPRFLRALDLFRTLQIAGALGMRVEPDARGQEITVLTLGHDMTLTRDIEEARRELRELLRLDPEASEFRLAFGVSATDSRQIAIVTRSLIQLMQLMASQVDVPIEHITEGRVPRGWAETPGMPAGTRLIHVYRGATAPDDAAVAIDYRGGQFWIDDRDLRSKRSLQLIMMMFTLASAGSKESLPLITIPAQ